MSPMSEYGRNLNVPNVLLNVSNLPNMLRDLIWSKSECAQWSQCSQNLNMPNVLVNVPNLPNMLRVPMWSKSECAQCPESLNVAEI